MPMRKTKSNVNVAVKKTFERICQRCAHTGKVQFPTYVVSSHLCLYLFAQSSFFRDIAGIKSHDADALSRPRTVGEDSTDIKSDFHVGVIDIKEESRKTAVTSFDKACHTCDRR